MLKELILFAILLGAICLITALIKAIQIYLKGRMLFTLSLVPALLLFILGALHFFFYVAQIEVQVDTVIATLSIVFLISGIFSIIVLTMMLKFVNHHFVAPNYAEQIDALLQQNEVITNQAKPHLYYENVDLAVHNKAPLLVALNQAISQGLFTLHFQKLHCIKKPEKLCFEALIRWPTEKGFVNPAEFIPLAEESNNIQAITAWVLSKVIFLLARWRHYNSDLRLQINISSKDLQDDKLVRLLKALLEQHNIAASQLTFEITETSMMQNIEKSKEIAFKIKDLGARISIDDYGSGFSSLSILSEVPIDEIKIDRSFVAQVLTKESHKTIVSSTVQLAHNLGCEVVAEGVECENIAQYLTELGCDKLQGYYFNKPMSIEETEAMIQAKAQITA